MKIFSKISCSIAVIFLNTILIPTTLISQTIVVPPPKTGDDIHSPPPKTGDDINTVPPLSPKPVDEITFCSTESLEDALQKCQDFADRERGRCEVVKNPKKCLYMTRYVKAVNTLSAPKSKPL